MATDENKSKLSDAEFEALRHWSSYGRPGTTQTSRRQPSDNITPFSKPQTAAWRVTLDPNNFQKLLLGFTPSEMEDKWVVTTIGPDEEGHVSTHMHRSWSGYQIIELSIQASVRDDDDATSPGTAYITAITWETDKEFFTGTGVDNAKRMAREVCNWVMGISLGPDED